MQQSRARRPPVETRSVVPDHLGFGRWTLADTVGLSTRHGAAEARRRTLPTSEQRARCDNPPPVALKTPIHMDGHEHIDVGTRSSGSGQGHVDGAFDGAGRDGVDERLVAIDDPDADFAEQ